MQDKEEALLHRMQDTEDLALLLMRAFEVASAASASPKALSLGKGKRKSAASAPMPEAGWCCKPFLMHLNKCHSG